MNTYDVHWVQSGITRVQAGTEQEAEALLTEGPFSDDAAALEVISVVLRDD